MTDQLELIQQPVHDRTKHLGGSEIAVLFGCPGFNDGPQTPLELYEEKVSGIEQDVHSQEQEKRLSRGKRLESWVLENLEEERGIFATYRNRRHYHPSESWMTAEIDFEWMLDDGTLCNGEIKTPWYMSDNWGDEGTDEVPLHVALQNLWGLMVTGRSLCLVVAQIRDTLKTYEVRYDDALTAEIMKRAKSFWFDHVLKLVPPPAQSVRDTERLIMRYGKSFVSQADNATIEAVIKLNGIKSAQKRLADKAKEYEADIKSAFLAAAESAGVADGAKKMQMNDSSGKKVCTLSYRHREPYTVAACDYIELRTK